MRIMVSGGRSFADAAPLHALLKERTSEQPDSVIIECGGPGAQRIAREWAGANEIRSKTFGTGNVLAAELQVVEIGGIDLIIVFPEDGGRDGLIARTARRVNDMQMARSARRVPISIEVMEPRPTTPS